MSNLNPVILTIPPDVAIAATTRAGTVDCVHYGSLVVVDRSGVVIDSAGDPHRSVFERSTTKPFKAVGLVESGAAAALGLRRRDLALAAGSHSGSTRHVYALRDMLSRLGLDEGALQCGEPLPIGSDAVLELVRGKGPVLSPLHCDCSGEHIGLMAVCLHRGWPIDTYLDPRHPVHEYCRRYIEMLTQHIPASDVVAAVDGCGLPTHAVPLAALARGFGAFAQRATEDPPAGTVWAAIAREPEFYGGRGRLDSALASASGGGIICKAGAEGVYAIAIRQGGLGMAIKVADGNHRGAQQVVLEFLCRLGVLSPAAERAVRRSLPGLLRDNRGRTIGEVHCLL